MLFPTTFPQWLFFFPQPVVNQLKKAMREELIFFLEEKRGGSVPWLHLQALQIQVILMELEKDIRCKAKYCIALLMLCDPVGLGVSMHRAAVV